MTTETPVKKRPAAGRADTLPDDRGSEDIAQLNNNPDIASETIAASQHARMLSAAIAAVAERGYVDTTIADIVRIACTSRKIFYEQFRSKEACFIAAYRAAHYGLVGAVIDSQCASNNWNERLRDSVRAYLSYLRDRPEMSRALLVEIHAAGSNAWECRNWSHDCFARMQRSLYELRRRELPGLPELPDELFRAAVAGIEEMVAMQVRDGRVGELMDLEPQLQLYLRVLYGGRVDAQQSAETLAA